MAGITHRAKLRWRLNRHWSFDSSEGELVYFPHGWGRGYVVPTAAARNEIRNFLNLWRARLMKVREIARWVCIGIAPIVLLVILSLWPPFCRALWFLRISQVFSGAFWTMAVLLSLLFGTPIALAFLAETAKAELEQSPVRRPFRPWLVDRLRGVDWRHLWGGLICGLAIAIQGAWFLWPTQRTIMLPAITDPRFVHIGLSEVVAGIVLMSMILAMMTVKRRD